MVIYNRKNGFRCATPALATQHLVRVQSSSNCLLPTVTDGATIDHNHDRSRGRWETLLRHFGNIHSHVKRWLDTVALCGENAARVNPESFISRYGFGFCFHVRSDEDKFTFDKNLRSVLKFFICSLSTRQPITETQVSITSDIGGYCRFKKRRVRKVKKRKLKSVDLSVVKICWWSVPYWHPNRGERFISYRHIFILFIIQHPRNVYTFKIHFS